MGKSGKKALSVEDIFRHEFLLLVHMFKKHGIYKKWLNTRYSRPHLYVDENFEWKDRDFVPEIMREHTFQRDCYNFFREKCFAYNEISVGSLIASYEVSPMSFDYDETDEGSDFWFDACDKIDADPMMDFIYYSVQKYKVLKQ